MLGLGDRNGTGGGERRASDQTRGSRETHARHNSVEQPVLKAGQRVWWSGTLIGV